MSTPDLTRSILREGERESEREYPVCCASGIGRGEALSFAPTPARAADSSLSLSIHVSLRSTYLAGELCEAGGREGSVSL